jgi:hypothetical protein
MLEITIARIKHYVIDWANGHLDLESSVDMEMALSMIPYAREIYLFGCGYTIQELNISEECLVSSLRLLATVLFKEDFRMRVPVTKQYLLFANSSLHVHDVIYEIN